MQQNIVTLLPTLSDQGAYMLQVGTKTECPLWCYCSMCWVVYNHLQGATVFEKYSWSALKALSEMVTAGEHVTLQFPQAGQNKLKVQLVKSHKCEPREEEVQQCLNTLDTSCCDATSRRHPFCRKNRSLATRPVPSVPGLHTDEIEGTMSGNLPAGYGKQEPETMIDVWVTMFSLLMGTTMWLILGSIITTLLIHLNAAHSEYTAKMTALSQYMMENNLPQVSFFLCIMLAMCVLNTSCKQRTAQWAHNLCISFVRFGVCKSICSVATALLTTG